jgi:hypothetical protein
MVDLIITTKQVIRKIQLKQYQIVLWYWEKKKLFCDKHAILFWWSTNDEEKVLYRCPDLFYNTCIIESANWFHQPARLLLKHLSKF